LSFNPRQVSVKRLVSTVLLNPLIRDRVGPLYIEEANAVREEAIWPQLLESGVWCYSLKKSGTTFFCNFLAAYRSLADEAAFDFDRLDHFGVIRGTILEQVRGLALYAGSGVNRGLPVFHTHDHLNAPFQRAVLMIRNPFDYAVSAYHFHYKRRRNKHQTEFAVAAPSIIGHYAATHRAQAALLANHRDRVKQVWYEDLMADPAGCLASMVEFVGDVLHPDRVSVAIQMTSVDALKAFEKRVGKAVVATGNFTEPHFVRSGKVGESSDVLDDSDIDCINGELLKHGLDDLCRTI
jgi:hypothetical protein